VGVGVASPLGGSGHVFGRQTPARPRDLMSPPLFPPDGSTCWSSAATIVPCTRTLGPTSTVAPGAKTLPSHDVVGPCARGPPSCTVCALGKLHTTLSRIRPVSPLPAFSKFPSPTAKRKESVGRVTLLYKVPVTLISVVSVSLGARIWIV